MTSAKSSILIIDGHPDSDPERFLHALAQAYEKGAQEAGQAVRRIALSTLEFPLLRTGTDFQHGEPPPAIRECQQALAGAQHVVILYPLWLGDMPALLKGFLEQLLRPGFAFEAAAGKGLPRKLLKGRSARIVVTMGMPALFYRWYYRSHALKNLSRNILAFCGVRPVRTTLIGMVENVSPENRRRWLLRMEALGRQAK